MKKIFIFIFGIICGLFLNSITDSINATRVEHITAPALSEHVESSNINSKQKVVQPKQGVPKKNVKMQETKNKVTYVKYWQSRDGFKFKDVGIDGVQKIYVWNNALKRWDDTGCIGPY